jgi:WD40 repeat protein
MQVVPTATPTSVTASAGSTIGSQRPLRRFPAAGDNATAVSRAAGLVAFGARDGSVRLLDLRTSALRTASGRHEGPVVAMRFSPSGGRLVTAGGDERLIVWDPRRATSVERLAARGIGLVLDLAVARDGRTAYSAGRDGIVIAWDLAGERRWERRFELRAARQVPPSALSVTANGSRLAGIPAGREVVLFDGRTLRRTDRFRPARGRPWVLRSRLTAGRWRSPPRAAALELWDTREHRRLVPPQIAHAYEPFRVTFSGDGRWLATADASIVRLWDVCRSTSEGSFVQGGGSDLSLSPDGTLLAVTALHDRFRGGLEIRSVPALKVIRTVPVPAGTIGRLGPDGRTLIYGDREGRIWTLDTRTWRSIQRTLGDGASIVDASVSPDGRLLATVSIGGRGRLWDLAARRPIGTALSGGAGEPIAAGFIGGGTHLAVVHEREGVAWDVRPGSWSRHACGVAAALSRGGGPTCCRAARTSRRVFGPGDG